MLRRRRAATLIAACAVSMFAATAPALADNGPHVKGAGLTPDTCAMCHRAHTAQSPYLLKESQTALCYTCHGSAGTGSSLDVADGVGYSGHTREASKKAGALRGGGFEYALIDSGHPVEGISGKVPVLSKGAAVTSTHSVDDSSQMAWGNGSVSASANYGATLQLTCGSCHDPHGNGEYRTLRPIPVDSGATTGIEIPDVNLKEEIEPGSGEFATYNYTTGDYWSVEDENDPNYILKVSQWCATCHTRYLAGKGSARKSSSDAVYKYRHRTNTTSQGSPTCVQCHVAHGSNASMGTNSSAVTNPDGTPAEGTPAGADSRLLRIDNRGVCQKCHNK